MFLILGGEVVVSAISGIANLFWTEFFWTESFLYRIFSVDKQAIDFVLHTPDSKALVGI